MALEDLIARLQRETEARSRELDARAHAEAAALHQEASRLAGQRRERELAVRRTERRARLDAALAEARRQARGARLAVQHAFLARIFARARAVLPEVVQSPEYLALVPQHLAEARRYVEGLEVVERGCVVSAADGSVIVDNTLATRLQRMEARLAVELLKSVSLSPAGERVGVRG